MQRVSDVINSLFTRDLSTTPLETFLFLFIIFGFFGLLIFLYNLQKKRERESISRALKEKWERLCQKYGITASERSFLNEMARYLENPEKKYLLLAHGDVFHNALREYSTHKRPDAEIIKGIIKKTGIIQRGDVLSPLPLQRRKNARKKVNLQVKISPVERETPPVEALMFNISRGGCMMSNPGYKFDQGDDLRLSFTIQGRQFEGIPAEVVRTSSGNKHLHIAFGHLRR